MLRIGLFSLIVAVTNACAQMSPANAQAEQVRSESQTLPVDFLGAWSPGTENYLGFGVLSVDRDTITWDKCIRKHYTVAQSAHGAHLLAFARQEECKLYGEAPAHLILELMSSGEMKVWICRDPVEFKKPAAQRACSWGTLEKKVQ